jgi:hypothetical protein
MERRHFDALHLSCGHNSTQTVSQIQRGTGRRYNRAAIAVVQRHPHRGTHASDLMPIERREITAEHAEYAEIALFLPYSAVETNGLSEDLGGAGALAHPGHLM